MPSPFFSIALLLGRHQAEAAAAAGELRRAQHLVADLLDAARLARRLRAFDQLGDVRHLLQVQRQQRLDHDVGVAVLHALADVGLERLVAGLGQRLAGADRLDAHLRVDVLHQLADRGGVELAEPFERPQRVEAADQAAAGLRELEQRRHDRGVLPQHQRAAAPCRATSRSGATGRRPAAPASRSASAACVKSGFLRSRATSRQMRPWSITLSKPILLDLLAQVRCPSASSSIPG